MNSKSPKLSTSASLSGQPEKQLHTCQPSQPGKHTHLISILGSFCWGSWAPHMCHCQIQHTGLKVLLERLERSCASSCNPREATPSKGAPLAAQCSNSAWVSSPRAPRHQFASRVYQTLQPHTIKVSPPNKICIPWCPRDHHKLLRLWQTQLSKDGPAPLPRLGEAELAEGFSRR